MPTIHAGLVALFLGLGVSIWQAVQKTRALVRMTDAEHAQSRSRAVAEAALTQEAEARRRVDELLEQETTQRLLAEKRIYATDLHLAQLAIDRDNFVKARELLSRHYPRPGQTNRPGWEWRYLWQQSQPDAAMEAYRAPSHFGTHTDVSPDARLLAVTRPDTGTASIDLVDITDLRNPRQAGGIASLQSNLVTAVAFNPRNGLLAHAEGRRSPEPDGTTSTTLALHDATTGRPVGTITNLTGQCRSLVWSGDGRSFWTLLLSGSPPQARLCLWRVQDLRPPDRQGDGPPAGMRGKRRAEPGGGPRRADPGFQQPGEVAPRLGCQRPVPGPKGAPTPARAPVRNVVRPVQPGWSQADRPRP